MKDLLIFLYAFIEKKKLQKNSGVSSKAKNPDYGRFTKIYCDYNKSKSYPDEKCVTINLLIKDVINEHPFVEHDFKSSYPQQIDWCTQSISLYILYYHCYQFHCKNQNSKNSFIKSFTTFFVLIITCHWNLLADSEWTWKQEFN